MVAVESLCFILTGLVSVISYQINLHLTAWQNFNEINQDLQHHCLYVSMAPTLESLPTFLKKLDTSRNFRQITSLCLSEWPFVWKAQGNSLDEKFTYAQLAELKVTSDQLYRWSAPIDTVESYQSYLDQLPTSNDTLLAMNVFYNCTSPQFGPQCEYAFPPELGGDFDSLHEFIYTFYALVDYRPTQLSCYEHIRCNLGSTMLCIDWSFICDGFVQCMDGVDEEQCWQLEINECYEDEYRCRNGQCIPAVFFDDHVLAAECLDQSDRRQTKDRNPSNHEYFQFRQPQFISEEAMVYNDPNYLRPASILSNRTYHYVPLIVTDQTNRSYDSCLGAIYCHLSFFGLNQIGCAAKCPVPPFPMCPWPKVINDTCAHPDIFYAPTAPIVFGHIYLAYSKKYLVEQQVWTNAPEYICYNRQYCGGFDPNQEVIILNDSLCRRTQDVLPQVIVNGDAMQMIFDYIRQLTVHLSHCNTLLQVNVTLCDDRTMYRCLNSTKCIAKIRLLDGYRDCNDGDDEDEEVISNLDGICSNQSSSTHFVCPTTNKCISRKLIRNSICNCGHSNDGALFCADEDIGLKSIREHISFPTICNGFHDLDPIMDDGNSYTDETECEQWLCNNTYTRCNGFWDCPDGADEIDCYGSLSDLKCPTRSFLCISPRTREFMCLPMNKGNDGVIDCLGGTDEPRFCRYDTPVYDYGFFCKNRTTLSPMCFQRSSLCKAAWRESCSDYEISKLCLMPISKDLFIGGLCDRDDKSFLTDVEKKLCYLFKFTPKPEMVHFSLGHQELPEEVQVKNQTLASASVVMMNETVALQCHHGIPLTVVLNADEVISRMTCLCLPNYYGSRCQYQNQRVSFTMKLQTFSDSWQTQFILMVSLIDDSDERLTHSFEQLTYLPIQHCQKTFDIYLLYSSRPKNESRQYSIHIDIFERLSLDYRGSLLVELPFLFLPVQRMASLLNIPHRNYSMRDCVFEGCVNGECIRYFNHPKEKSFCRCHRGWTGQVCTIRHECNCSSDSLCHGVAANNRSICICPVDKWGPQCLIPDHVCKSSNPCKNNGTCIALDQHVSLSKTFECICPDGFHGKYCELLSSKIILSFSDEIDLPTSTFIHFIKARLKQAPERGVAFKKIPINRNPITIYWPQSFHISFAELSNNRYYLISQDTNHTNSKTVTKHITGDDYCPHVRDLFNETFAKLHLIHRIKYYHVPCRNGSLQLRCFYDDDYYCLCVEFNHERQANCLEFDHQLKHNCSGRSICENGGQCLQDSSTCPQVSACICPPCYYGAQCQFSSNRHSLSLDAILGYHIHPHLSMAYQPKIVQISLVLTILLTLIGLINGILSMITFLPINMNGSGCALYLLASSISTLFCTMTLLIKFVILTIAQMTYIEARLFLYIQCVIVDYLIRIGLNMDQWLNACIAFERAAMIIKGVSFSKKKSMKTAKVLIWVLLISTALTNIIDPIHRRLIEENNNDEKRIWCILTYPPTVQTLNVILNIFHFCVPVSINFISALIIIIRSARFKSSTEIRIAYRQHLRRQFQKHRHLLISSSLLFLLATPRLVFIFSKGCMKTDADSWWFLIGYSTSFLPPILSFVVFVLPSKVYTKQFYTTIRNYRQATHELFCLKKASKHNRYRTNIG